MGQLSSYVAYCSWLERFKATGYKEGHPLHQYEFLERCGDQRTVMTHVADSIDYIVQSATDTSEEIIHSYYKEKNVAEGRPYKHVINYAWNYFLTIIFFLFAELEFGKYPSRIR